MIEIFDLKTGYKLKTGDKILASEVNLSATKGELIAVAGVNGSGKSTLLRIIAGLNKAVSGNLLINGKDISEYKKNEYAKKVSFVSSEILKVKYLKVYDTVASGRFPYQKISGKLSKKDKKCIYDALKTTGMLDFKDKFTDEISDGERQKVMISRALAQDTDIVLLDEPAAFLDLASKFSLYKILSDTAKNKDKTIIFSTHDLNIAFKYCDKVWLLKDKKIYEDAPEDLFLKGILQNIFDNEEVSFNPNNFEFSVKKTKKYPVNLITEEKDNLYFAISNALAKRGFYVSDRESEIKIEAEKKNSYKIKYNSYLFYADNIYELIKFAELINNKFKIK